MARPARNASHKTSIQMMVGRLASGFASLMAPPQKSAPGEVAPLPASILFAVRFARVYPAHPTTLQASQSASVVLFWRLRFRRCRRLRLRLVLCRWRRSWTLLLPLELLGLLLFLLLVTILHRRRG